jgi:coniferyl-aldehyde dehydrogenase
MFSHSRPFRARTQSAGQAAVCRFAAEVSLPQGSLLNADLRMIVATMRRQQLAAGFPDAALRRDRLERVAHLISENHMALAAAAAADRGFGVDPGVPSADLMATTVSMRHAARHVGAWMAEAPERQFAGSDPVSYWPQGVIGIIAPWTHPVSLALAPLAGILAAGNVALIKLSHHAPRCSDLVADLVGRYFAPGELGVVLGDDAVGAAFAELPLAHLVFTGSARTARAVSASAAARLLPVTLAVGGKSAALVSADADIDAAACFIMTAKLHHAGQSSRAVDHVLVAASRHDALVAAMRDQAARILSGSSGAPVLFPASVKRIHRDRLVALIEDAEARGSRRIRLGLGESPVPARRAAACRLDPEILLDVDDTMAIMQEEVFGPILPVMAVADDRAAIERAAALPRPALAWYFGADPAAQAMFVDRVPAATVMVNPLPDAGTAVDGQVLVPGTSLWSGEPGFQRFAVARRLVFGPGAAVANHAD